MPASFLTRKSDTFAAGLDVRVKLLLCAAGSVASIVFSSPLSLGLLVVTGTALALTATRPTTILKVYLFSTLMMLFSLGFSGLIGLAVPDLMRWDVYSLSVPFLRMLVSINLLLMLSLSTPVQVLSTRLQSLRFPGWVQIPLTVAIRFIPTFMSDCTQIRDAARLRPGKGIRGLWRGLVVPLVFRLLYSADDLAIAAELKGMSAEKRMRQEDFPPAGKRDYTVLALAALVLCTAVAIQLWGPQFKPIPM